LQNAPFNQARWLACVLRENEGWESLAGFAVKADDGIKNELISQGELRRMMQSHVWREAKPHNMIEGDETARIDWLDISAIARAAKLRGLRTALQMWRISCRLLVFQHQTQRRSAAAITREVQTLPLQKLS
jgi:hypothetical protein